ncbi:MAG: Dps family protein [Actinomycetes bacterium]|jgi:starvation-inducible DNA-binding protein
MGTGIAAADRKKIVAGLSELLADTYTLYLKTQGYHWNVTGENFRAYHLMFEEQYQELALAVDEVAERIRALDAVTPASFKEYSSLTVIPEAAEFPAAEQMVADLIADHEKLIERARPLVDLADEAGDVATADLVTTRIEAHEKTLWMLRATAA